jgi:TRAP-type uncharacterized transport system substrate-binding protein
MLVPRIARLPRRGWGLVGLAFLAFALAAAMFVRGWRASSPVRLTVSNGVAEGQKSETLTAFVLLAAPHGIVLRPVDTSDSADAIARVDAGTLDMASVQGGIDFSRYSNVRQVTSLQVLPLHLLVKDELADEVTTHLGALRGKVVNLGAGPSTGTYWLTRDVLAFAGLDLGVTGEPDDYRASTLSAVQLAAIGDRARLPDAIFLVAPLPSPLVHQLVERHHYRLVPLLFRDAFALGAIFEQVGDVARRRRPQTEGHPTILREHIVDTVIPAFAYQADPGVPPAPLHTLGVKALLIANRRIAPAIVGRVIEVLFQTRYAKLVQPPLDVHRLEEIPEIPWHPGAVDYLERSKPALTGELVSQLVNLFGIAGPVCGGILFLWQLFRQRSRLRREQRFETYIAKVSALEQAALECARNGDGACDTAELERLWRALGALKAEALGKFAEGETSSEAMLTSFLTHVNDARSHLAHLIDEAREGAGGRLPPEGMTPCR